MASGRSEVEYNEELSRHALRKFLDLVLFLDRAKVKFQAKPKNRSEVAAHRP